MSGAGNGLPGLDRVPIWFNDPANWAGPSGLIARLGEHLVYTAVLVVVAAAIAIPVGLWIGHTGRGLTVVAGIANGVRAIPALGLLVFLIVVVSPAIGIRAGFGPLAPAGSVPYLIPVLLVLIVLALPPIITATYAGVQSVDPAVRDAARGMGMGPVQMVLRVELPCALPLVASGVRSATLQVVATLTVAAYAPLVGGLGRLIVDGDQNLADPRYGYPAMVAAGITIAALAIVLDAVLALLQRLFTSPGVSGRFRTRAPRTPLHLSPTTLQEHTS